MCMNDKWFAFKGEFWLLRETQEIGIFLKSKQHNAHKQKVVKSEIEIGQPFMVHV